METNDPTQPLILVTNDDGINSPGLRAAVRALLPLGEVLVVAPERQWSGAGRSMPPVPEGRITLHPMDVNGRPVTAYGIDASPALAVAHAVLELAPRPPALLVSGINYGENLGRDVTISGTVGAALQGAAHAIPALAVSLQTPKETHENPSAGVDFEAASHFARRFARQMIGRPLPPDVDVLKIDVPDCATPETPWRVTRASRNVYFVTVAPPRDSLAQSLALDYRTMLHPENSEPDSDIHALAVDRVVAVTPISLDLTSRIALDDLGRFLRE
jgi:5'-nucleotidase